MPPVGTDRSGRIALKDPAGWRPGWALTVTQPCTLYTAMPIGIIARSKIDPNLDSAR
jgi:hypothetical protein